MNRNRFLLLVAVTLAAVVLVALLGRPGGSTDDAVPETLLPALAGSVNDVEAVDIVAPGGRITVSLRRDEERWRVVQKDGYEAEFAQVLELLRTLAEVRIVEPKTSKPAWYPQLGVQDVTDPDATGRRLDFPGREIASVIVGQSDPSGEGSYARRAGEERSWLLDEIVEVPVDPVAWLEPGVMDIPSGDIAEVIVRHPDGETVQLKGVGDQDRSFVLMGVPEGREAGESFKRNALANGLRSLNLEDVRRFEPPAPADRVRVLFTTTDGLNFVAEVFERDEAYWVHFTVSPERAPSVPTLPEQDDDGNAEAEADENRRLADAVAVDARLSPWLFGITQRRFDDLTPRLEDLLAPLPDDETGPDQ
ncbi:MAG: DUF4340 domain-containing protein [Candidatus Wenzhouxiangella sp. M2_3B_020]